MGFLGGDSKKVSAPPPPPPPAPVVQEVAKENPKKARRGAGPTMLTQGGLGSAGSTSKSLLGG